MRTMHVSMTEFQLNAYELFRHIEESGERVVVTDHGNAALEILQYRPRREGVLDLLRGSVLKQPVVEGLHTSLSDRQP